MHRDHLDIESPTTNQSKYKWVFCETLAEEVKETENSWVLTKVERPTDSPKTLESISVNPACYSVCFLSSSRSLICSPSLSPSGTTLYNISPPFISVTPSLPPCVPASLLPLLVLPLVHWLNMTARWCPIPLCETSRCILWSSLQKTCRSTSWDPRMTSSPLMVVKAFNLLCIQQGWLTLS